jgi:hypothetical protein
MCPVRNGTYVSGRSITRKLIIQEALQRPQIEQRSPSGHQASQNSGTWQYPLDRNAVSCDASAPLPAPRSSANEPQSAPHESRPGAKRRVRTRQYRRDHTMHNNSRHRRAIALASTASARSLTGPRYLMASSVRLVSWPGLRPARSSATMRYFDFPLIRLETKSSETAGRGAGRHPHRSLAQAGIFANF